MAKKASIIRVFQVAKELGVASKDVVAKCQAEGIPGITNHMSTVSQGLAATVREWFGEGASSVATAVQTAAPVDVVTARAKAKKKATKKKAPAKTKTEDVPVPVAEAPAAAEAKAPTEPVAVAPEPVEDAETTTAAAAVGQAPVVEPPPDIEAAAEPVPAEPVAEAPTLPATVKPPAGPTMNIPDRPEVVKPAGPMLEQPTRTTLTGPKIIRVESPDIIRAPSPMSPSSGSSIRRSGPRAGRGVGVTLGESSESPTEPVRSGRSSRRNKRRTAAARDDASRTAGKTPTTEERPFNWRTQDLREREARLSRSGGFFKAHRRDNLKRSAGGGQRAVTAAEIGGSVTIAEPITIKNLSLTTGIRASEILKKLFLAGKPATVNATLDAESAAEVMLEFSIELEIIPQKTTEDLIIEQFKTRELLDEQPRSPVVTILGHVDHGKTSLLDRIRDTTVAAGEAGGITQATSAFQVPVHAGDKQHVITFIDTPGHEAFTEMRARGANITDLVVLVVAADDGVMPQTVESINHAKAAGVPIVVALNKMDKPEAVDSNIQRILGQLAEHELNPAEWGGTTEIVRTSAATGDGIQELLEVLDYQAELLELKADFAGEAQGTVLEAQLEEGRGPVASLLVQQGCLRKGDFVVVGRAFGRVRDIVAGRGQRIDEAFPSAAVAVSGIDEVPDAGDKFYAVKTLKEAETSARERETRDRERELSKGRISFESVVAQMGVAAKKELPILVKADVQGSVDALRGALEKISTDEITIAIKHAAVGGVNESDVVLAHAARAMVIGFNVTAAAPARQEADARNVDIRLYDVIYDITDDVTKAAEGLLEPEHKLEVMGHAEVREVFKISKVGMVAGCYVTDGVIERNAQIRVTREDIVVEKDRRLQQLKRFKEDAKEVRAGQECGMKIDGYDDIKVGDVLECYRTLEVRRTL